MDAKTYKLMRAMEELWTSDRKELALRIYEQLIDTVVTLSLDIFECVKKMIGEEVDEADLVICTLDAIEGTREFLKKYKRDILKEVFRRHKSGSSSCDTVHEE